MITNDSYFCEHCLEFQRQLGTEIAFGDLLGLTPLRLFVATFVGRKTAQSALRS